MSAVLCYRCCRCQAEFGEPEALCEDWMDPTRSFICPHCAAHLLRPETLGLAQYADTRRALTAAVLRWLPLVVAAVLLTLVLERAVGSDAALVALVLMIPLALWYRHRHPAPPQPLRTYPADLH